MDEDRDIETPCYIPLDQRQFASWPMQIVLWAVVLLAVLAVGACLHAACS